MEPVLGMLSADGFGGRLRWLVRLRWIAILGVVAAILFSFLVLHVSLPLVPLIVGTGILILLNLAYSIYQERVDWSTDVGDWHKRGHRFAHVQIAADLTLLAYFIYFSGGAENPFIFFFIFHMVIASILLSKRSAYLQAGIAAVLLGGVFSGEVTGFFPHHHLEGFIPSDLCLIQPFYVAGVFSVFTVTIFITVFMATSIMDELRKGEVQLARANQALEEQDRIKSQYVLRVSHDIKSSLSTIQSCVQVVLSDLAGPLSEKGRDILGRAERRSQNLLIFVRDLLDLSKMRSSTDLDLKVTPVIAAVKTALEQIRPIAEERGIALTSNLPRECYVYASPGGLEEVLLNLVGDGVKYTLSGGEVVVSVHEQYEDDLIELIVSDTGIGIGEEDLPFVFDDFYRAKNAMSLEKDGSGLGLSIAKQIVDSIGGRIWVESKSGKGTQFHLLLPRATPPKGE